MAPTGIPFVKAHGLGNDFLLVEDGELPECSPGALAVRLCDRHTGVGADGLVVLGTSGAEATFRIYNADGSEATLSGNGLRCAAAWLLARAPRKETSGPARVRLQTRVGPRELFLVRREANAWILRAEIGRPFLAAADVPFRPPRPALEPILGFPLPVGDETVAATILSMGNPQCVIFVDETAILDWLAVAPEIERHPFFPDRVNVGFARVVGPERIEARFWERGAGHTLASGTGACACAVAAHLAGKVGRRVTVVTERGEMEVHWREDGVVELTGPAEITAEGTFHLDAAELSDSRGEA